MVADAVRRQRFDRWLRTVERLRWLLRLAMIVAAVGSGVGLLAYWADDSCSSDGDLGALFSVPMGIGYLAMLVGLPVAAVLIVVGVWSDPRGPWWKTLGWVRVGLAVVAPAVFIASLACFG